MLHPPFNVSPDNSEYIFHLHNSKCRKKPSMQETHIFHCKSRRKILKLASNYSFRSKVSLGATITYKSSHPRILSSQNTKYYTNKYIPKEKYKPTQINPFFPANFTNTLIYRLKSTFKRGTKFNLCISY